MAVLPVCRSPMISSRWPRPIGVIASIALIPVCSGSLTLLRCTTEGACSLQRARISAASMSPWPSSGTPERVDHPAEEAVADRHGQDLAGPADLLALLDLGEVTEDDHADLALVQVERERRGYRPGTPAARSHIAEGSPSTRAMPSPHSATTPTSSLDAASGSYAWTKLASASRISSGRIVSSAMVLVSLFVRMCGPGLLVRLPRAGRPVPARCGAGGQAASCRRSAASRLATLPSMNSSPIRTDMPPMTPGSTRTSRCTLVAVRRGQRGDQALPLVCPRAGWRPARRRSGAPATRHQPRVVSQAHIQATSPGMHRPPRVISAQRRRGSPCRSSSVSSSWRLALRRRLAAGQRGPQLGRAADHPAEPEQLVLDVVQVPGLVRRGRGGQHRQSPRWRRSGRAGTDQRAARTARRPGAAWPRLTWPSEQGADQPGPGRRGAGWCRSAHGAARLAVQQPDHAEQLLARARRPPRAR